MVVLGCNQVSIEVAFFWCPATTGYLPYRQEGVRPRTHVTDPRGIWFLPPPCDLRAHLHLFSPFSITPRPIIFAGSRDLLYLRPMDVLIARLDVGLPFRRVPSLRRVARNVGC